MSKYLFNPFNPPSKELDRIGDIDEISIGSFTPGSVLFAGASLVAEDNANLFWDDTLKMLGIGTNAPITLLHLKSDVPAIFMEDTDDGAYWQFGVIGGAFQIVKTDSVGAIIKQPFFIDNSAVYFNETKQDLDFYFSGDTTNYVITFDAGTESLDFLDNVPIKMGTGKDVEISYNNSDLIINTAAVGSGSMVLPKTSGIGIKVDATTPTFGWRDLEGFEIPDPTGGDRPTLSTYSGGLIKENAFSNGDVLRIRYHIPHDYVKGTDIFSHIHWSHNGTAVSGNVVFGVTSDYAKGHNQANFGTEKSISITYNTTDISTTPQYRQRIEESAITSDGGSATLIDRGLIEPDGIILVTFEVTTNPTITGGSPNNVFVHRADLHYRSSNIATKDKVPDFYS